MHAEHGPDLSRPGADRDSQIDSAPPVGSDPTAGREPVVGTARRGLRVDQLELLASEVEDGFLIPFLARRARPDPRWPGTLPKRLGLSEEHLEVLEVGRRLAEEGRSWRHLARERRIDPSQLTRRHRAAADWLGTARFLLFRDPDRWSLRDLFLSSGDPRVLVKLHGEADAICDVFDQIERAPFEPHLPVPLSSQNPRRLSDEDKDLIGWAARSLLGPRSLYLDVQGATGKRSTVDLSPNLDALPASRSRTDLAENLIKLSEAIEIFERLAASRLHELRRGRS